MDLLVETEFYPYGYVCGFVRLAEGDVIDLFRL